MIELESRLAWLLADEVTASLASEDKAAVYTGLGAGEIWPAITYMLTTAVDKKLPLPAGLIAEFATWLDNYVGAAEEPATRQLLTRTYSRTVNI